MMAEAAEMSEEADGVGSGWRFGIVTDEPHQKPKVNASGAGYKRYTVEFDDQGVCYQPQQLDWLSTELTAQAGQQPIIVVFVHGWKHNARTDDDNLRNFDLVLAHTARAEREVNGTKTRPVIGIYVGWRGLSFYFGWFTNLTFWNRKTAALRVALGSVRELFGRLRYFRQRQDAEAVLIIIGHSFGGLIAYSALAQSLIELATFSDASRVEPSFANLVLLVNPAFEAARYLPIHGVVDGRTFAVQLPVLISVTAQNDRATGVAFPIGAWLGSRWEHARTDEEKAAMMHTMGHLDWMWTHMLTASHEDAHTARAADDATLGKEREWSDESYRTRKDGWVRHFDGGAVLRHHAKDPSNPFWVVRADQNVINGHNGIWKDVFFGVVRKLVAEQLRDRTAAGSGAVARLARLPIQNATPQAAPPPLRIIPPAFPAPRPLQ